MYLLVMLLVAAATTLFLVVATDKCWPTTLPHPYDTAFEIGIVFMLAVWLALGIYILLNLA